MTPLTRSAIAGSASVAITAGVLFGFRLREKTEIRTLRSANDEMMFQIAMRPVLTGAPNPEKLAQPPTEQSVVPPTATLESPSTAYRDAGQETPIATLQTVAWACDRGDTTRLAALLHFDPAAREKAEAYLQNLPAETRAQWASPEQMAAAILAATSIHQPFPEAEILDLAAKIELQPDRIVLRLPGTLKDRTEYQQVDGSWKYVITEQMANGYLSRAAERASGP